MLLEQGSFQPVVEVDNVIENETVSSTNSR